MNELTTRQAEILDYIKRHVTEHDRMPTVRNVMAKFELASSNGVNQHMAKLAKKGFLFHVPERGYQVQWPKRCECCGRGCG